MPNVNVSGYIDIPEELRTRVAELLPEHMRLTRQEPGCILFEVAPNADTLGRYDVRETFQSREDLEYHRQRSAQSEWGQLTQNFHRRYFVTESRG